MGAREARRDRYLGITDEGESHTKFAFLAAAEALGIAAALVG